MANNYYNFPVPFVAGTKVRSEQVNTQYQGVEAGFDLLSTDPDAGIIGTTFLGTDVQGATINEYLITTPDPRTPLVNGQRVSFFATHSNDGAVTLNVDGSGLVAGVNLDGDSIVDGQIISGQFYEWVFDNANTQWLVTKGISGLTDPLLLSNGSVGAPTYSFELDPDTGMFQNGADILGFAAGGFLPAQVDASNGSGNLQFVLSPGGPQPTATFPSLAFGDGDTGFHEPSDDQIAVSLGASDKFFWAANVYGSITGTGPAMLNETASSTNPTLVPDRSDIDTGLGQNASGEPSLIGNGVEQARGVAPASGGLLVNNTLTGGGLERALTTGDVGGLVGDVFKVGTPVNNQLGVWTGDGTIEGDSDLTWDGTTLSVTGNLTVTGTLTGVGDVTKVGTPVDNEIGVWTGDGTIEGDTNFQWDGSQLLLAPLGSAAAPVLGFGDGDTGFFESIDDTLQFTSTGVARFAMNVFGLLAIDADSFGLFDVSTSATAPTLLPRRSDTDSGIGQNAADELSLIAGGVEGLRLTTLNSGVIQAPDANVAVTAFAGGGQGSATQLDNGSNVITTVATAADSVKLPPVFAINSVVFIKNDGVNAADVFPASGDNLGSGVDIAVSLVAGASMSFIATVANSTWTQWIVDQFASGAGDVFKVGTPVNNQVGIWTGDGTIEGTTGLTYDGSTLDLTGDITLTGTVDGIDIATDVAANTAKVTNATHTGQVTGATALALDITAITAQPASGAIDAADTILTNDGGVLSEASFTQMITFFDANLSGGGGIGDVFKVATPADNELAVWTGDGTLEGSANWIVDGAAFRSVTGNGPQIRDTASSSIIPTFAPRQGDLNTGIGNAGDDRLSLIAGGVAGIILVEASSGVIPAYDVNLGVTAFAGGGIGSATQLNSGYNTITTVATTGDSVKLAGSNLVGSVVYVKNDGANACDLFPAAGDDLGFGVSVALSVSAGASVAFMLSIANTTWTQIVFEEAVGTADVFKVGTPVDNEIGVWTGDGTIEGDPDFTWDGAQLLLPQADTPAAPTLGFGDGDSGFYEETDDTIAVALGGAKEFEFGPITGADAQFGDVELLTNLDGADGATTFTEQSNNGASATFVGTAELDTAEFKFGTASLLLDGNSDYIEFPDLAGYHLAANLFTIEGWVRFASTPAVGDEMTMVSQWSTSTGTDKSFAISVIQDGLSHRIRAEFDSVFEQGTIGGGGAPALNTWFHFAAQRSAGDLLSIWFDGLLEFEAAVFPPSIQNSTETLKLGVYDPTDGFGNEGFLDGWVDDVRITIGSTRYATGGSITPPTAAFPTNSAQFTGDAAGAGKLFNQVGSLTTPTLAPRNDDDDTGIGGDGDDILSVIAGGVEGVRFTELNDAVIPAHDAALTVTAFAGGGQGSATQLDNGYNVISTVATEDDSVKLPPVFAANSVVYIKNDGANSANVFPASGDDLGSGTDTAITLAAGRSLTFIATVADSTWTELLVPGTTLVSGGLLSSPYKFDDATAAADPGPGLFRYNNATLASVTAVFIDDFNEDGDDISNLLSLVTTGDRFYFQTRDNGSEFLVFNVTAPITDNTGWFTITGTVEASGTIHDDGDDILVVLQIGGGVTAGDVFKVGTPVDNEIGVWTGDGTLEGDANFTWDGAHLNLPQLDDAATPTLAFGDGDTGLYENGDDNLRFAHGGVATWAITSTVFQGLAVNAPAILNSAGSATVPNIRPSRTDGNTGLGQAALDQMSLIAGGVEMIRLTEVGTSATDQVFLPRDGAAATPALALGATNHGFFTGGVAQLNAAVSGTTKFFVNSSAFTGVGVSIGVDLAAGPRMFNETPSATNPTLAPRQNDSDSGIGSNAADQVSIIAGGVEIARAVEGTVDQFIIGPAGPIGSAAAPSLAFGDGDTGFFETFDDTLRVTVQGVNRFLWADAGNSFQGAIIGAGAIRNEVTSGTNPTVVPSNEDTDTGLGRPAADQMSLIAGGVEMLRVVEGAANQVIIEPADTTPGTAAAPALQLGSNADGFFIPFTNQISAVLNGVDTWKFTGATLRASDPATGPGLVNAGTVSLSNPGLVPLADNIGTGIGSSDNNNLSIIVDDRVVRVYSEATGRTVETIGGEEFGLTASVTQTQAGGLLLRSSYNEIATVANVDDAVTAFEAAIGAYLVVINNGANRLQLFPAVGDDFGAGVNAAVTIAAGQVAIFLGRTAAAWDVLKNGPPEVVDNDVVQARRTTDFTLTTAFVDVTLDTTDVESNAVVLDHDLVTNTDNIIIGETGTYKIGYEVDAGATTTGDSTISLDGRVRLNDGGTGIAGSESQTGVFEDGSIVADFMDNHLSHAFFAELTAGDFVTLQLQKVELGGSETYVADRILLTAERCL